METIYASLFWHQAFNSALKMAKSKLDANDQFWVEDIAQNAVIKAFLNIDKFDSSKGSFTSWLSVITKNLCFDFNKRKEKDFFIKADFKSIPYEYELDIEEKHQQEKLYVHLENCLEQLNEKDKKMIVMKYFNSASSRTISSETDIPEANIPMYMKRAKKKLQNKMLKFSA